jgi:hypothetical protein
VEPVGPCDLPPRFQGFVSAMEILRQLSVRPVFEKSQAGGFFSDVLTFENEAGRG